MVEDMAVYIANLGKYNEGYLVGDWFRFPLNEEEIAERIGLNAEYEEYAVHDTENFPMEVSEYISIEELNNIYDMLEDFPDYIVDSLDEFISHYGSLEELAEHTDEIYHYPDCETMTDVAYYFIDELQMLGKSHRSCKTISTMKPTDVIYPLGEHLLKQTAVCAKYHIRAGRSATSIVASDSSFTFKDSLKYGCPFPIQRKEFF